MTTWPKPVPLDPTAHQTEQFSCGVAALDRWLQAYAGQSQRRDAARTFVVLADDHVAAYYTLVATEIDHDRATSQVRRGLSRHFPIPGCLIARLAVDERHQHAGLGAGLLRDALTRSLRVAEHVGLRTVVVDATSDDAANFYLRFGFRAIDSDARTLMGSVAHLRAAG